MNNEFKPKIGDFGLGVSFTSSSFFLSFFLSFLHRNALMCDSTATNITETTPNRKHDSDNQKGGGEMTGKVGTYLYASPEMVSMSRSGYDEKVDIYALGIILFEMWHPFSTGMERCKVLEALRNHLQFPQDFERDSTKEVQRRLIRWLVNKDPKQRPSAMELLRSLPEKKEKDESTGNEKYRLMWNVKIADSLRNSKEHAKIGQLQQELISQLGTIKNLEHKCKDQQAEIEQLRKRLSEFESGTQLVAAAKY